jgi:CDP-diacylglycerol--glycerol-3-phosphate 3-phosphatidyltransferase
MAVNGDSVTLRTAIIQRLVDSSSRDRSDCTSSFRMEAVTRAGRHSPTRASQTRMPNDNTAALRSLQRRWLATACLGGAALVGGSVVLVRQLGEAQALRWLAAAAIVFGFQLAFVGRRLRLNFRAGEAVLLPDLGPGNSLTLARGVLLAMLAGFLIIPWPKGALAWAPAALYMAADLADYFDGYLARISRHATRLGEAIDLEFDALGLLVGVSVAIHIGQLPLWFLPFGLARYAFVFGIWILQRRGRAPQPLPESVSRRPIAGLTMAFVSAALWPLVLPSVATLAGVLFAIPFAFSFGRDWLVVSGVLDPLSNRYATGRLRFKRLFLDWLPPFLRLSLAAALVVLTTDMLPSVMILLIIQIVAGACIAVGLAGRLASIALIVPLALGANANGLAPLRAIALGLTLGILILGTGAASLWKPEERLLRRRAGERDD